MEVEVQHKGLQELIATLKDGRGAHKVAEWHNKMEALRLVELRHKREISRLKEQVTSTWLVSDRSVLCTKNKKYFIKNIYSYLSIFKTLANPPVS